MAFDIFHVPLYEIIIFVGFGLGQEVIFTGITSGRKNRFLMGYSSVWYLPIYVLAPFLLAYFFSVISNYHWFFRGLVYAAAFLIIEFVGMLVLKLILGKSPSEDKYLKAPWNIYGLIRLDYLPFYFFAGLLFEWLYISIH